MYLISALSSEVKTADMWLSKNENVHSSREEKVDPSCND